MTAFSYDLRVYKQTTRPLEIYSGNTKCYEFHGYYSNVWKKVLDIISRSNPIINYKLKDLQGNDLMIIENKTGLGKRKIHIRYMEDKDENNSFLIEDISPIKVEENAKFEYKGETYYIKKIPLKPAYLVLGEEVIAEYKVDIIKRNIHVKILDPRYYDKEIFILGVLHGYLYTIV